MLDHKSNRIINIFLISLFSLFIKFKIESRTLINSYFPVSLTLNNDNILLITKDNILFYDDSLTYLINSYNLSISEIPDKCEETYKTLACQYPQEYNSFILIFIIDQLYFFDKDGNKLQKYNFTSELSKQKYYEITPIKTQENELYYIISLNTKANPLFIKLSYYKMNINTGENSLISEIIYTPITILGEKASSMSDNIACTLMNSDKDNNILACFYSIVSACQISVLSFSLKNDNITELPSYSTHMVFNEQSYINLFKVKSIGNKSKAYIAFISYELGGYTAIYDINLNNIYNIEERVGDKKIGTNVKCFNFYYFERTEQFVLSFRDNIQSFIFVVMNKTYDAIYNKNGEIILTYNNYYNFYRESIIYLKNEEKYVLLSDAYTSNELNGIKIFSVNITNITGKYYNEYDSSSIQVNSYSTIFEEKKEKEKEKDKNKNNFNKENKCFSFTEESLKMNLCTQCNIDFGFYPVNYKEYNIYPNEFKECFSEKTKEINFFFNKEKMEYEPCFETCNTCNYGGDEEINNCTSCDIDSIFRPETDDTTNCVKKCKYKYYFTSYGQYKCTENDYCPKEAQLFIKDKNKCIEDCKLDDKYKYQINGECLDECPSGTNEENNICIYINKKKCTYKEDIEYLMYNISNKDLDLLAKKYAKEYIYTFNHISIYKNDLYTIALYKNKECINELSLNISNIDFSSCYEKIKSNNFIDSDLIILIIERYYNGSSIILYEFYNPITGDKIDVSNECQNVTITVEKNLITLLQSTDANIDMILKLTKQNIDVFNKNSEFYNDICFNYESPNGKDIPLKDRLIEFYPNITLCDNNCLYKGINYTTMCSICQCKFTDFFGDNFFTENFLISKISDEISEIVLESNLLLLQCYKNVFTYIYFAKNTGGFVILTIIFFQTFTTFFYYFKHYKNINQYIFNLMELYLSFLDKTNLIKLKGNFITFFKNLETPPKKYKNNLDIVNNNKRPNKPKTVIFQNNSNIINLNIKNLEINKTGSQNLYNKYSNKNTSTSKINPLRSSDKINTNLFNINDIGNIISKNFKKRKRVKKRKSSKKKTIVYDELENKLNKFMNHYLSTDIDDFDYDDAIKMDNRKFCQFFWERLKTKFIFDIILIKDSLKPRPIKILLLLINIDLYFLINALFMNEDYISEVYHSTDGGFFSFLKRTNYSLFYITTIGAFSSYLINCFFFNENKIKRIFITEKNDKFNIKKEIYFVIKNIQSGYILFFVISYIITIFSWYFISCFNNVYPYTRREWIYSSISLFLFIQILYLLFALIETIIRFISFKLKSEKLFKISQIFS